MRSSASASPAPLASATLQQAAAPARSGRPMARESSRRAPTTSPPHRIDASVRGAISPESVAKARSAARVTGCPARRSATISASASRVAARHRGACRWVARRRRIRSATGWASGVERDDRRAGRITSQADAAARRAARMSVMGEQPRLRPEVVPPTCRSLPPRGAVRPAGPGLARWMLGQKRS